MGLTKTLNDILIDVNSYVDLEAELPTGDELTTRTNYANQAVWDAFNTAQLNEFTREYQVDPSTNVTISLPTGFSTFKGHPKQKVNGAWVEFPEILPEEKYDKSDGDKYCYVMGNPSSGYVAIFNGLEASCTLSMMYQSFPSGMATLSDVCEISDPTFVVAQTESYILQARGDERFPFVNSVAQTKLRNLVTKSMRSPGGQMRSPKIGFTSPLGKNSWS